MRTVRVPDMVFDGIRKVADREGISMASVLDRMLTYPCSVCGEPVFPSTAENFREFMQGKTQALKSWGHGKCVDKKKEGAV